MSERESPSRSQWAALAVAALLVRGLFFLLPLERLDAAFVLDDTWYTLSVARGLAAGAGPLADSFHLTNSFQPLIAFLVVPFCWLPLGTTLLAVGLCAALWWVVRPALRGASRAARLCCRSGRISMKK